MNNKYLGIKCSFCKHKNYCETEKISEIEKCRRYMFNECTETFECQIINRLMEETNQLEREFRHTTGDGIYIENN